MHDQLSPKQVANAIDVSESSVKRWCDKGLIPTHYTAGGHRRIGLAGLMEFLKSRSLQIPRPELLGLPSNTGRTSWVVDRAADALAESLVAGREEESRRIVLDLYLGEHSLTKICDKVIAPAFEYVGDQWECGEAEVYQERLSCQITSHILQELRTLTPNPPADAALAIGGAPEGDQYSLATQMAELALLDIQWDARSLGANLPLTTFAHAIKSHRPRIFWLSCSHIESEHDFVAKYAELFDEFGGEVAFVVGGRALTPALRQQMNYAAFCDNMGHLQTFAQTLQR